jgi:hypothetical protein
VTAPGQSPRIVTAATENDVRSLVALLGSLTLNWPRHPPVIIYDLGLSASNIRRLQDHDFEVRSVERFCAHAFEHGTWKLWCLHDAPTRDVLWMDPSLVVLRPLDEIFHAIERLGYFLTTNHELLDWEASEHACRGCGVTAEFRMGRPTLVSALMGFRKGAATVAVVADALAVACVEANIAPTHVAHRGEQAIVSLLAYKHLGEVVVADGALYLGRLGPAQVPGQKIWLDRRWMLDEDVAHLAAHLSEPGEPYRPRSRHSLARAKALSDLYRVHWWFGRGHRDEAERRLRSAFAADPSLWLEPQTVAVRLREGAAALARFSESGAAFLAWTQDVLRRGENPGFVEAMRRQWPEMSKEDRA